MPRLRLLAAYLVAGAAIAAIIPPVVPVAPAQVSEPELYYPTKVGAKSVYLWDGELLVETVTEVRAWGRQRVVSVNSAFVRDIPSEPLTLVVNVSPAGVRLMNASFIDRTSSDRREELARPSILLKLPHRPGETWVGVHPTLVGAGSNLPESLEEVTVGGEELVSVPAGTFRAIRLDRKAVVIRERREITEWHAPGIGLVKRVSKSSVTLRDGYVHEGSSERVLNSFTPGKD